MKSYQSHKVVKAAKIISMAGNIEMPENKMVGVEFELESNKGGAEPFIANLPVGVVARGWPAQGDYLVTYEDGYHSWSPADVFEDGYKLLPDVVDAEFDPSEINPVMGKDGFGDRSKSAQDGRILSDEASKLAADRLGEIKLVGEYDGISSRTAMQKIREDACAEAYDENGDLRDMNVSWIRAWFDLMQAADRLDAMMARSTGPSVEKECKTNIKWVPVATNPLEKGCLFPLPNSFGEELTHDITKTLQYESQEECENWVDIMRQRAGSFGFSAESYPVSTYIGPRTCAEMDKEVMMLVLDDVQNRACREGVETQFKAIDVSFADYIRGLYPEYYISKKSS